MLHIKPQPGPQQKFFETDADIAVLGGAAGVGKSFALLLEPMRHAHIPAFGGVIFRRTMPQIRNEGGLFDESMGLYSLVHAKPNLSESFWTFPSGASIGFSHLEHDKNIYDWQGAQICYLAFDELTHFTRKQFFYMLSRNRSTCGVKPYIRATTNPDKKSWLRGFLNWWIYQKGHPKAGLAIPERSGVVRWFIAVDDKIVWADRREDFPDGSDPKSFTFISGTVYDNKILLAKDPGYLANLKALPRVERAKLLDANWDAEEKPGEYFQRSWFPIVKVAPVKKRFLVRYWDRAASEGETADYTVGLRLSEDEAGRYYVENMERFRATPSKVEDRIKNCAASDTKKCSVGLEQDPGQAGKFEVEYLTRQLAGFHVLINKPMVDKATRAKPVSSQAEAGNICVVEGSWNEDFFTELEAFDGSGKGHDDIVDTLTGAFTLAVENKSGSFTDSMTEYEDKEILQQW